MKYIALSLRNCMEMYFVTALKFTENRTDSRKEQETGI